MRKTKATRNPLAKIPAELVAKVTADAERDAEDVVLLLRSAEARYRMKYPDRPPPKYPREMLLGLKLAMRLQRWERSGVPIHLAFGLPSSTEVIRFVTTHMQGPELEKFINVLSTAVLQIVSEYLLWWSPESKDHVEMVIAGATDEEVLLDAVVELVFQSALRRAA